MGKAGSSAFSFLRIDAYDLLPAKVQGFVYKIGALLEQTDGLGDRWEEHTPTGQRRVTITQTGAYFDTDPTGMHAAFKAAPDLPRVLTFAPGGGLLISAVGTLTTGYEVLASDGKLTKANVQYAISGSVEEGVLVQGSHDPQRELEYQTEGTQIDSTTAPGQSPVTITGASVASPTVITTAQPHGLGAGSVVLISGSNSTPTLNGERAVVAVLSPTTFTVAVNVTVAGTAGSLLRSNSVSGAVGFQEVTLLDGLTGFVGKIRDSADGTVFADLVTFPTVTTPTGSARVTVAGVIDRYLSFDGTLQGPGRVTVCAGLKRT